MSYTIIPNEIFEQNQISIQARYMHCVLLKYCGKKDYCYPSQNTLGCVLGISPRHVRNILKELETAKLIYKTRTQYNRPNTYAVAKSLKLDGNPGSYQLGSLFPLQRGNEVPPKSTYIKGKDKMSVKGLESMREIMIKKGLKRNSTNS